jgi:hypothetical protein
MAVSFQCCFCERGIETHEESEGVILNASSLAKWKQGQMSEGQSFYAHATCLVENCKTSYPWEVDAILAEGDADEGHLKISITRWVDDAFPGFVECEFVDVSGVRHTFVDKVPVVTADPIDSSASFPLSGSVVCTILSRNIDGSMDVEVDLPLGAQRTTVWLRDIHD